MWELFVLSSPLPSKSNTVFNSLCKKDKLELSFITQCLWPTTNQESPKQKPPPPPTSPHSLSQSLTFLPLPRGASCASQPHISLPRFPLPPPPPALLGCLTPCPKKDKRIAPAVCSEGLGNACHGERGEVTERT